MLKKISDVILELIISLPGMPILWVLLRIYTVSDYDLEKNDYSLARKLTIVAFIVGSILLGIFLAKGMLELIYTYLLISSILIIIVRIRLEDRGDND